MKALCRIFLFSLCLLIPSTLLAQGLGSIVGTITDPSGAVVSGAKVTLTNLGTNATLSTTAGSDGNYTFTPVRVGSYKIDVSASGFQTSTQRNIPVDVSSHVQMNFALKPGSVTEVVEVTSSAPVLETQSADGSWHRVPADYQSIPIDYY